MGAIADMKAVLLENIGPIIIPVLEKLASKVKPIITDTAAGPRLRSPDRRLSFGIAKRDGRHVLVQLVEQKEGPALQEATEIEEQYPAVCAVEVTGKAYSSKPDEALHQEPLHELSPGSSVGHYRGFPGSLGGFVEAGIQAKRWHGFISASHVLAMNNTAEMGDPILHPGSPDGARALGNKIGTLADYTYLVHYQDKDGDLDPLNTEDIALVKPDDAERLPSANLVPNPKDQDKKIKLSGYVPADQIFERVGEEVYKVGRTTGFTSGILDVANIMKFSIQLPNRKIYIYKDVYAVKNIGQKRFSRSGDSGSLVYTADGKAIGLVIGGSDKYILVSPLSTCLKAVKAELLV